MLLSGADSIRDVIAFPKAASGLDPLTGAPTPITRPSARKPASTCWFRPVSSRPAEQRRPGMPSPGILS